MNNIHSFNVNLAEEVGIIESIVCGSIFYWVEHNKANEKNFHDGKYWSYNTIKAWSSLFPYLSESQVRRALSSLIKSGYIEKGNFNKSGYDRTGWYTVNNDKLLKINICQIRQMDLSDSSNGFVKNDNTIPVQTNSNTNNINRSEFIENPDFKEKDDRIPVDKWGKTWKEFEVNCPEEFRNTAKTIFPDQSFDWFEAREALKSFYEQNRVSRSLFPEWKWRDILIKNLNKQKRK